MGFLRRIAKAVVPASVVTLTRSSKRRIVRFSKRILPRCRNFYWRKIKRRRVVFVTFADGRKFTSDRLAEEVRQLNFFDRVTCHSADTLGPDFINRFAEHLKIERGYGLWSWKPHVILKTLDSVKPGDIVVYADAGCTVASEAKESLEDLFNQLAQSPDTIILADDGVYDDHLVRQWTKSELVNHLGFTNRSDVLNRKMWEAGRLALQNSPKNRTLVEQWRDCASVLRLIDDSESMCGEIDGFREHRHDQSILNLLLADTVPLSGLQAVFYATRLKN